MKLFLIKYKVEIGQGSETLAFEDQMAIPGKAESTAKGMFLDIMNGVSSIIMSPGPTKILVPIRAFTGKITILSCTAVKTK